jgi:endoglucanase
MKLLNQANKIRCALILCIACGASCVSVLAQTVGDIKVGSGQKHLMRYNGTKYVIWEPHGVVMVSFEAAPAAFNNVAPYLKYANQNYSTGEIDTIKNFGADTIRFMVSQPGTDPQDPNGLYSAAYINHFTAAVQYARSIGLNVILNVQDETPSGEPNPTGKPNAATQRSWQRLAPIFNGDHGIMYEIYNEPGYADTTQGWTNWQTAMNSVITTVRGTGSQNVILADGLSYGGELDLAANYLLSDSESDTAYAVHPYFNNVAQEQMSYFQSSFGTFAQGAAVVVTEWYPGSAFFCDGTTAQSSLSLYQYLSGAGIGITAFAYDFPGMSPDKISGSIGTDFAGTPTTFLGTSCGDLSYGPGTVLKSWYNSGSVPSQLE